MFGRLYSSEFNGLPCKDPVPLWFSEGRFLNKKLKIQIYYKFLWNWSRELHQKTSRFGNFWPARNDLNVWIYVKQFIREQLDDTNIKHITKKGRCSDSYWNPASQAPKARQNNRLDQPNPRKIEILFWVLLFNSLSTAIFQ